MILPYNQWNELAFTAGFGAGGTSRYEIGLSIRRTNTDAERQQNNQTKLEVTFYGIRLATSAEYDLASRTSNYRHGINGAALGNQQDVSTSYDMRNASQNTIYRAGYASTVFTRGTSRSIIINHRANGSAEIQLAGLFNGGNTYIASPNGTFNITLETIPRASVPTLSSNNFEIGTDIAIETNRLSASFTHSIYLNFGTASNVLLASGIIDSYKWQTTDLFSYLPNANSATGIIKVETYDGLTLVGNNSILFTANVNVTNSNPDFLNFDYKDVNPTTLALTGNNQTAILGYSNIQGIVTAANKAEAQNSATMNRYRFTDGTSAVEVPYSENTDVNLTLNNVRNATLTMFAIDSRNNSKAANNSIDPFLLYSDLSLNPITVERSDGGTAHETILQLDGTFWNHTFGAVTNSLTVVYEYRESGIENWVTGTATITPVTSTNSFSYLGEINGDLGANGFSNKNFDIRVTVADKLSSFTRSTILNSGTPNLAIGSGHRVAIGKPVDNNLPDGSLDVLGGYFLNGQPFAADHALLTNLDYDKAGHVGFLSGNLVLIQGSGTYTYDFIDETSLSICYFDTTNSTNNPTLNGLPLVFTRSNAAIFASEIAPYCLYTIIKNGTTNYQILDGVLNGTSGNWRWWRFDNRLLRMEYRATYNVAMTSLSGSVDYGSVAINANFPVPFIEVPSIKVSRAPTSLWAQWEYAFASATTLTTLFSMTTVSATRSGDYTFVAEGRWK